MGYAFRLWLNSNPSYISPHSRAASARSTPLALTFIQTTLQNGYPRSRVWRYCSRPRHTRSQARTIWYPPQNQSKPKMDARIREYDDTVHPSSYQKWGTNYLVSISQSIQTQNGYPHSRVWQYCSFLVIPEVRHELSGIHLAINPNTKWIPAFASMTVLRNSIAFDLIFKLPQRHIRSEARTIWYPPHD